jgi:hypothetical protein
MSYTGYIVDSAWEAIFMLVVLKIPLVYLGVVVWWAIRAEPVSGEGGDEVRVPVPLTPCGWEDWKRRRHGTRRLRPSGGPGGGVRVRAARVRTFV